MKITGIEKCIIGLIVVCIIFILGNLYIASTIIERNGGLDQTIIKAGIEVKQVYNSIKEG